MDELTIASIDIAPSQTVVTIDAVRAALRERMIPAVVGDEDGTVIARVALTPDSQMVIASDGTVTSTAPEPILDSLAAEWSADVLLESDGLFLVGRGRDAADLTPSTSPMRDLPLRVYVLMGERVTSLTPLAQQLEASVTVAEVDGAAIVVAHEHVRDFWPPAQRPVVALTRTRTGLTVEVFSGAGLAALPEKERMRGRGIPDLTLSWPARWVPVLSEEGWTGEVQRMLRTAAIERMSELADDRPVLDELRVTRATFEHLRRCDNDDDLPGHLTRALRLPAVVEDLVRGRADIANLPCARRSERTDAGRRAWELASRPSWWSRLLRRRGNDEGPGDRGRAGPS